MDETLFKFSEWKSGTIKIMYIAASKVDKRQRTWPENFFPKLHVRIQSSCPDFENLEVHLDVLKSVQICMAN